MNSPLAVSLVLCSLGCASTTPLEQAELVRAQPGTKALRVGLVTLSESGRLRPALPAGKPAADATPVTGDQYSTQTVLPESIAEEDVRKALSDLGAFTDVVPLPFDGRGVASHEALVQRVQDRLWPVAAAQQLDAILVVDGVRDRGLSWSDADQSLFSLTTVLWWLTWPFGVLIPDRSYTADVALSAWLFSTNDQRSTPQPRDTAAGASARRLRPWTRAATPVLGFVVPPVWLGDDHQTVSAEVREWSRATLPIELVRRLKELPLTNPADVQLRLFRRGDQVEVVVESAQELSEATLVSLPRGALTEAVTPVPVALRSTLRPTAQGPRHLATGRVAVADLEQSGRPLVRVRVVLTSGEPVSLTSPWAAVPER